MFPDVDELFKQMFTYTPMTDEQMQASYVNDIQEWADAISGEWNGKESGRHEERAHCAQDIISKCNELKELLTEMENL